MTNVVRPFWWLHKVIRDVLCLEGKKEGDVNTLHRLLKKLGNYIDDIRLGYKGRPLLHAFIKLEKPQKLTLILLEYMKNINSTDLSGKDALRLYTKYNDNVSEVFYKIIDTGIHFKEFLEDIIDTKDLYRLYYEKKDIFNYLMDHVILIVNTKKKKVELLDD